MGARRTTRELEPLTASVKRWLGRAEQADRRRLATTRHAQETHRIVKASRFPSAAKPTAAEDNHQPLEHS